MRRRFVYRDGVAVDRATGEPMLTGNEPLSTPLIREFRPYACPITGKEIRTPRQHADNLKRHDCVEYNEVAGPSRMGGKLKNERFAKKMGREVAEEYR